MPLTEFYLSSFKFKDYFFDTSIEYVHFYTRFNFFVFLFCSSFQILD